MVELKIGQKVVFRHGSEEFVGVVVAKTLNGSYLVKFCELSYFMHDSKVIPSYLEDGSMYEVDGTNSYYFVSCNRELRVLGEA